jgi:hypothetical protein
MAGAFGFEEQHCDISARVGEHALLPAIRGAGLIEVIIADGFSCREQISQMTERHGLHIAEVLELALKEGPAGPRERRPEQRLVDEHKQAVQKSKLETVAVVGGLSALITGALGARKILAPSRSRG